MYKLSSFLKRSYLTWLMREILIDGHHVMELSIWLEHVSMTTYTPIEVIYTKCCLFHMSHEIWISNRLYFLLETKNHSAGLAKEYSFSCLIRWKDVMKMYWHFKQSCHDLIWLWQGKEQDSLFTPRRIHVFLIKTRHFASEYPQTHYS